MAASRAPWPQVEPRGREFLTCGIRERTTDKLKTCRHSEPPQFRVYQSAGPVIRSRPYLLMTQGYVAASNTSSKPVAIIANRRHDYGCRLEK